VWLDNRRPVAHPLTRLRSLVREGRSDAPGHLVDVLGRIGLVGYGVVHLFVAWLALQVAFGVPDAPADAEGAVGTIAPHAGRAGRTRGGRCRVGGVRAVAGHLARALALGVIGVLAGSAALLADPGRAGGLDAALRTLSATALGSWLLVVVAVGFAAFGLFCLADAGTRRA